MSLDLSLNEPGTCGSCNQPASVELFWRNITHNVTPMWRLAGCYDALYRMHGRPASEALPALRAGLTAMRSDPNAFRMLNSPNGWGTYEGAVDFLEAVVRAFEAHPDATIEVCA